ncbi:hypothetical protein E2C01_039052 [Portunus trituberculatus]|uniref:Uncharacterized protein n=1 Tax=Portunus trituberculatus TaxID=210409 RepID=A0A5B7FIL4_PORTR|nr:hypothetical protein [Portunus trituberculatus]
MLKSKVLAGDCLRLREDRRLLRCEGVEEVVPSELWEGVGLIARKPTAPLHPPGQPRGRPSPEGIWGHLRAEGRLRGGAPALLLGQGHGRPLGSSDSVARVEARVVARPLLLRVGGCSSSCPRPSCRALPRPGLPRAAPSLSGSCVTAAAVVVMAAVVVVVVVGVAVVVAAAAATHSWGLGGGLTAAAVVVVLVDTRGVMGGLMGLTAAVLGGGAARPCCSFCWCCWASCAACCRIIPASAAPTRPWVLASICCTSCAGSFSPRAAMARGR